MKYQLKKLLSLTEEDFSIHNAIEKYFAYSEILVDKLYNDLNNCVNKNTPYVFPDSNPNFAITLRLLTISGFLLCYEITNNDIFTLNGQQFINNKKFATPDVFFYILIMLNEILEKSNQNKWKENFKNLIGKIDQISQVPINMFEANFEGLLILSVNEDTIIDFSWIKDKEK